MISKSAAHAIRAVVHLANTIPGDFVGTEPLARAVDAPPNYLGKLLAQLIRPGLIESRKGIGGGVRLARPAASIRLIDVIDPIDNVANWDGCFLGGGVCTDSAPCVVHGRWVTVREQFMALITETTIAQLTSIGRAASEEEA